MKLANYINFEGRVIDTVVGMDNIRGWHSLIERKDFGEPCFLDVPKYLTRPSYNP